MENGVLLVNLGTPKSSATWDVFRYLNEFLTDPRVIDIPWLARQLLVRGIIVPKRVRNSARTYKEVWTEQGSPLLTHGLELERQLQKQLGKDYLVVLAMRYQEPSMEAGLARLKAAHCKSITILPLFPQYASATTGSVHEKVMQIVSKWNIIPELKFIQSYPTLEPMIEAFAEQGRKHKPETYDHVLFSFHGLPERHVRKADATGTCLNRKQCCSQSDRNPSCYKGQCYATATAIAKKLHLDPERYTVSFQSRLGKEPWLQPYTTEVLEQLAHKKVGKLLVYSPAFVCDCLETSFEIGVEYAEDFVKAGGKSLTLVEGLNTHPTWVNALETLLR